MDEYQDQEAVVIYLDELGVPTDRQDYYDIPSTISELTQVKDLTIRLDKPEGSWSTYPPISWYETRELKKPFRHLPESVGELKNLRSLTLTNLDIHTLPESIANLTSLNKLNLSMNKLDLTKELPKLGSLTNLKSLNVIGNHYDPLVMQSYMEANPQIDVNYKVEEDGFGFQLE